MRTVCSYLQRKTVVANKRKLLNYYFFNDNIFINVKYILGVGGIEAEAVMLGQAISMVLPKVVGYKLTGQVKPYITSTDVVLTITKVCNF